MRDEQAQEAQSADIVLPPKLVPVFTPPRGSVPVRGARGGRGSSKSYNFALMAAVFGYMEPMRILCTREYQASIRESFHAELKSVIEAHPFLDAHYEVGVEYIRGRNGTEFFFRGLRNSMNAIKSMAHVDLTIVEEAEDIPEYSWQALLPTVMRQSKSEVWVLWNPRDKLSPVDKRYVLSPPSDAIIVEMNHRDNPFFPAGLEALRQEDEAKLDTATYDWIWEGAYLVNSNLQVLHGRYEIKEFTPGKNWDGPYQGGDWGFAQDPTAAVRCWVHADTLYVEYEAGGIGVELDDTGRMVTTGIPNADKYVMRWDNARPESISHVKGRDLPLSIATDKWPGSVKDGIAHLRAYKKIVVHPRCREVANECRRYSHKVDRKTSDILPEIVDAYNHYIDAIRYALSPLIRRGPEPNVRSL